MVFAECYCQYFSLMAPEFCMFCVRPHCYFFCKILHYEYFRRDFSDQSDLHNSGWLAPGGLKFFSDSVRATSFKIYLTVHESKQTPISLSPQKRVNYLSTYFKSAGCAMNTFN